MSGESDNKHTSRAAMWTTIGLIATAVATVAVAVISSDDGDHAGQPPAGETTSATEPTTPVVQTSASVQPAGQQHEDREQFRATIDGFRVEGVVVWPASGPVRSAGEVKLGDRTDEAARCAVRIEYEARAADGRPVGPTHERACPPAGPKVVWPKFGPVIFENDPAVAEVVISIRAIGDKVVTLTCPRSAACTT